MKRWALVVVALYLLILAVLTIPVVLVAFAPGAKLSDASDAYGWWPFWLWLGVMGLGQGALLIVPVKVASRRPVARRSLLWPVIAAGLMMGGLTVGAIYSICEFALQEKALEGPYWWAGVGVGVVIWAAWAVLFYRSSGSRPPAGVVSRQCRLMLQGSILELLVAVPTHIAVRHREYCCAGAMTFVGLAFGISVMLFSFGPAVFFLYADRWRRLRAQAPSEAEQAA